MRRTRIAALTAAGALAVAGTGVAVATTSSDDPKEREQAVLADAAERLDVEPSELRDALSAAENAQLDADVKAGRLTQEQADAIKERRDATGTVLGPGIRFQRGPHLDVKLWHPGGRPIEVMDTAANALGISRPELMDRLRDGKTIGEIAEAEAKSMDDVRAEVEDAFKAHFDKAVEEGHLTREQADKMLTHSSDLLDDLGRIRIPERGRFGLPAPPPGAPGP